MNSTTDVLPNNIPALGVSWGSVAYCVLSFAILARRAIKDQGRLRFACSVMGFSTIGLALGNALRIGDIIPEPHYLMVRATLVVLFVDLMVVITLSLGAKFYISMNHVNALYWSTVAATALMNVLVVLSLILRFWLHITHVGMILITAERVSWPMVLFLSYWYAFY